MRVSPLCPELPPATTCELMVIAPSDMAVQLLPSAPSARLKSSEAVSVPEPPLVVQVTATVVMFAEPTVPVPLLTVQVWPDGWVRTVTAYALPPASFVGKAKEPFAVTVRLSPPLSCSTTVPDSPETVPPTEYVTGGLAVQVTATFVTFAEPTVPVPLPTVQVWPDGCVITVTAYAAPLASCVGKAKEPFAVTVRLSPPLSCSTTVPDSPETVPPTEYVTGGLAVQATATFVMFAEPTVPVPLPTVQVWPDGCVFTVTAYAAPLASCVGNGKGPVRGHGQVVAAIILQHHRPGQARNRAADGVARAASDIATRPVVRPGRTVCHDAWRAPVRLVSVTVMTGEPLRRNEIVEPVAVSPSVAPAASPLVGYDEPSWVQLPQVRLIQPRVGVTRRSRSARRSPPR